MLEAMVTSLPDLDPESLKNFLRGLIDRVVLDASSLAFCIPYKIKLNLRELVASPTRACIKGLRTKNTVME